MRWTRRLRLAAVVAMIATTATSCYAVIGDSTMVQICGAAALDPGDCAAVNGQGFAAFTHKSWDGVTEVPYGGTLDPAGWTPAGTPVIVGVSLHDAACDAPTATGPWDCTPDVGGYAALPSLIPGPAYVVALPPVASGAFPGADAVNARIPALNAAVADALGCTLVPAATREAETFDGVHYTALGAAVVALRLSVLDPALRCW